jgi:uncharacterized protein
MAETALVIMARYPQNGTTKTRLARALGDEETVQLYRAFLTDLARRFAGQKAYDLHWACTPAGMDFAALMAVLAPSLAQHMRFFPQEGDGLGERLHNAFRRMYAQGYRQTVVIGSDSPQIGTDTITKAGRALDKADVVLGPAEDGGYYLIAMRKPYDVFQGVPMSTSAVLRMTVELALSQDLAVNLQDTLFDVDELPDLERLADVLHTNAALAPATAALLATIKELA